MGDIFQQAISLTGSFNLWLILTIFAITMVAEFGFSVPYLLETIWLLTGYHTIGGNISPGSVLVFCLISLIGREIGAVALYKISMYGGTPLLRLLNRMSENKHGEKQSGKGLKRQILGPVAKFAAKRFTLHSHGKGTVKDPKSNFASRPVRHSALNVALGRFVWLKIPITVTMGMARRPVALLVGVALFSLAWDGLYITLGIFGAGSKISPVIMIIGTLSALVLVNTAIYVTRRFLSARRLAGAGN